MTQRALIVCPGRGTYTKDDLGSLHRRMDFAAGRAEIPAILDSADALRRDSGSIPISELDGADRYSASKHMKGENAGPLIFTSSAVDWALIPRERFEPIAIVGNSMGWYTSLHCGGVFNFEHAFRVVDFMSKTQGPKPLGGQVITPWVDEDWRPRPERRAEILALVADLRSRGMAAEVSIELGGYLVLAGDDAAVDAFKNELPKETQGKTEYPFQLAWHAAFHTQLMVEPSQMGRDALVTLPWQGPATTLVDGAGRIRRPGQVTPREIFDYTLIDQVVETYHFSRSLRVALREFAPDVIVLLGPGQTLGGAIGQSLALEGWQGIRSKSDFIARQKTDQPVLISMGRAEQFARFMA